MRPDGTVKQFSKCLYHAPDESVLVTVVDGRPDRLCSGRLLHVEDESGYWFYAETSRLEVLE